MMNDRQDTLDPPPQPLSLRRWSQRKLEAAQSPPPTGDSASVPIAIPPDVAPLRPTASAPFVATLVDVTGLVIYFSVGIIFLRGTLL